MAAKHGCGGTTDSKPYLLTNNTLHTMKSTTRDAAQAAQTSNEVSLSIDEVAELYKSATAQIKDLSDKASKYKEQLLQYGTDHAEEWTKDGLVFDNGVRLIKKVTVKQFFDEDEIDIEWLEKFISAASGSCVKIGFDQKKVEKACKNNSVADALLDEINYGIESVETTAVLLK